MCTGKCSKCIGVTLFPLVLLCALANFMLLFPDFSLEYLTAEHITPEILYLGGIIGGGGLVLIPALHIFATRSDACCSNRCGMLLSLVFAVVGIAGSSYCLICSVLGVVNGPYCLHETDNGTEWGRAFQVDITKLNITNLKDTHYLLNYTRWDECLEPPDVVVFNLVLFNCQILFSFIQLILCICQLINGFFGTLCGTCK
ncbi:transmembrane 4 L6 family member 1 [Callorhinchus milii]|uniref:Transmembrane 4 L6 family member 1-like n=1 Tax=Callorhinchus milii TaxID=7868 RepID=V9L022_CALMI|nr:transmembrane 4 L6 family member 1 [Callorhinchus milii]|eukprot:gi/632986603/ref/XP_007910331.1/ PREDICTED: transmembrane 4 L6 family member 1-like [Callorhinchus milii]